MFIKFKFAYLILTIPFILIWFLLFILRRNTRKEQVLMSLIIMFIGPISEIVYFQDYWVPKGILNLSVLGHPFLIEDLIFGFVIGGIGGVVYEIIFRKRLNKMGHVVNYKISLLLIILICLTSGFSLFKIGLNSIYATSSAFIIGAILIIIQRKDLLINSLISGIIVMLVMFVSYFFLRNLIMNSEEILEQGWLLYHSSLGFQVFGIPLTEMIWGFSWGMFAGPVYEFARKLRLEN